MIPRVLYYLVLLSLTAFATAAPQAETTPLPAGAIEIGDAVTPISETEVIVDEFGVEWIQVPDAEEEAAAVEARQDEEAYSTMSGGGGGYGGPKKCKQLQVRKEW